MENLDITQMINNWSKPIVCIQTFKTGEDGPLSLERTLNDINPRYIIMYHSNVSAIRQIEVFEARRKRSVAERLKVFFMIHAQTVEEQSYLTTLRREKQAFELMIETKSVRFFILLLWEKLHAFYIHKYFFFLLENGRSGISGW